MRNGYLSLGIHNLLWQLETIISHLGDLSSSANASGCSPDACCSRNSHSLSFESSCLLASAAPARAPARRGLRRSAPGCRRLLRLPRTDNEGQACRVTSASRRRGLRRGVGPSLTPRPLRPSFSLAGTWTPPSFYCPPSWVPRACCRHSCVTLDFQVSAPHFFIQSLTSSGI